MDSQKIYLLAELTYPPFWVGASVYIAVPTAMAFIRNIAKYPNISFIKS